MTMYFDDLLWRKDFMRDKEKSPVSKTFAVKIDNKVYNLGSYYMDENKEEFQNLALYFMKNKIIFDKNSEYYLVTGDIIKIIKKFKLHQGIYNFNILEFIKKYSKNGHLNLDA